MAQTTNYNLNKPGNDNTILQMVTQYNGNMDTIDSLIKTISDKWTVSAGSADLDTLVNTGFYTYTSSNPNIPTATGGTLLVIRTSSTYIYQVAFCNSSGTDVNRVPSIRVRFKNATNWSTWRAPAWADLT